MILEFIKKLGRNNARDLAKGNHIEVIIDKEEIARLLLKLMVIQFPTRHQVRECLLSTANIKQIDNLLNSVKSLGLKCFVQILEFMEEAKTVKRQTVLLDQDKNKFYQALQTDGIKAVLQSLFQLCRSDYSKIEEGVKVHNNILN